MGLNTATWAILNLRNCEGGARENCIERQGGGDITLHRGFENIAESEVSGINTRFGGGFRTSWGVVGMRGAWRYVIDAEQRYAGVMSRYVIARNAVRVGFLVKRGNLSAIWTANYRAGFENQSGTGEFESWTGHDIVLDWADPLDLEGARSSTGVFNLTDTAAYDGYRQPQQHGRTHRSRLGAHLLPHLQHEILSREGGRTVSLNGSISG